MVTSSNSTPAMTRASSPHSVAWQNSEGELIGERRNSKTDGLRFDYTSDSSDQSESSSFWDPYSSASSRMPTASPLTARPRKHGLKLKSPVGRGRMNTKHESLESTPACSRTTGSLQFHVTQKPRLQPSFFQSRKRSADKNKPTSASKSPHRSAFRLSLFFTLLRYPLLAIILSIMGLDLTALLLVRLFVFLYERFVVSHGPHRKLLQLLSQSTNYESWKVGAAYLDSFMRHDEWKHQQDDENEIYNQKLIRKTTKRLNQARIENDAKEVMKHLTHACKKNHGGCMNEALYSNSYIGTKVDLEMFYQEVEAGIKFVAQSQNVKAEEKSAFFKSLSKGYGRAALSLSGGGSLTYYHMGVLKSLFEEGMLPEVITGTSGGSLLAALICTRTDEELISEGIFDAQKSVSNFTIMADPWSVRIKRLLSDGYLFDPTIPFDQLGELTKGHMTFLEAYQRTGRILCISVTPDEKNSVTPSKVLNFLTAPDVVISSAICASCAIPLILPSIKLLCKTELGDLVPYRGSGKLWRDGSIRSDIPDLSRLNVTFQIVSQVNPHVTIFFYESQGSAGCPTPHRGGRGWRGGFIASSMIHMIDLDLKKWLRLCKDLKLLPPIMSTDVSSVFLQQFDGAVTILPANSNVLPDCVHILEDPSAEKLEEYITQGQLKTFPKLGMIGHRMRIENCIKDVMKDWVNTKSVRAGRSTARYEPDLDE